MRRATRTPTSAATSSPRRRAAAPPPTGKPLAGTLVKPVTRRRPLLPELRLQPRRLTGSPTRRGRPAWGASPSSRGSPRPTRSTRKKSWASTGWSRTSRSTRNRLRAGGAPEAILTSWKFATARRKSAATPRRASPTHRRPPCEKPWLAPCAASAFHSYQYGGTYEVTLTISDVGGDTRASPSRSRSSARRLRRPPRSVPERVVRCNASGHGLLRRGVNGHGLLRLAAEPGADSGPRAGRRRRVHVIEEGAQERSRGALHGQRAGGRRPRGFAVRRHCQAPRHPRGGRGRPAEGLPPLDRDRRGGAGDDEGRQGHDPRQVLLAHRRTPGAAPQTLAHPAARRPQRLAPAPPDGDGAQHGGPDRTDDSQKRGKKGSHKKGKKGSHRP